MAMDEKYVVFRRRDWDAREGEGDLMNLPEPLDDAVVIRTCDVFAPAGLHAYAHLVHFAVELANFPPNITANLEATRDYFLERAHEADERFRRRDCKYPD